MATLTDAPAKTPAATRTVATDRSDALIFFGATGDLAYKKIFPALQNMVRRGTLDVPVIGVAKADWTRDQLLDRVRASLNEHGGGVDATAFGRLADRLDYVDGDYADPKTFSQLRQALGSAQRPAHYLAIPPSLFGTVVQALGSSGCATTARVAVRHFAAASPSAQSTRAWSGASFPPPMACFRWKTAWEEGLQAVPDPR